MSAFVFLLGASCTREALMKDKYITLSYAQTQCSDPWGNDAQDTVVLKKLGEFLAAEKLYAASAEIKVEYTGAVCLACTCLTGKVFYVTTFDNDEMKAAYRKIGFTEN